MCDLCKKVNALKEDNLSSVDEYFKEAVKIVIKSGNATISSLQRKLIIGYSRAVKLIDQMESCEYISPCNECGKRKVLITPEQFRKDFGEEYNS